MSKAARFVINQKGETTEVLLPIKDYNLMRAELEELESIRAYDQAKASREKPIPFEQAVNEIERK